MPNFVDRLIDKAFDLLERHFIQPCANCLCEICLTFRTNRGDPNAAQGSGDETNPVPSSQGPTNPDPSSRGPINPDPSSGGPINLYIIKFSARNLAIVHSQNIECWEWVKYPSDSRAQNIQKSKPHTGLGDMPFVQIKNILSFSLQSAESPFVQSARHISMHWPPPVHPQFMEVAVLKSVSNLEIKATVNFHDLSPQTTYTAFLIFKTEDDSEGLSSPQEAYIEVSGNKKRTEVCLKPSTNTPRNRPIVLPKERLDKWMELELGQFDCDDVTGDKKAEISIMETNGDIRKSGLIVAGMEICPIDSI